MFLQAAGHADVVDPQEAAAGEGDIPGGVQREHGLRAPLEAEGAGGKQQRPRRRGEAAGFALAPPRDGRDSREALLPRTSLGNTAGLAARRAVPAAKLICGGPALGPAPGMATAPRQPRRGRELQAPPANPSSGELLSLPARGHCGRS